MAIMNKKSQFPSCIISTSFPVQIWPEPAQTPKKLQRKKKQVQLKESLLTISKNFRKFYNFFIIIVIISVIFSNGYLVFSKLTQYNSGPKNVPNVSSGDIFQTLINPGAFDNFPVRLKIPSINVDVRIQPVGQTPEGAMDVPSNISDAGWYKFGPKPGQKGSSVIDAHVDGPDGSPAVFSRLHILKEGDSIIVENNNNKSVYFVVKKISSYPVDGYVPDIFYNDDGIHLNLITCNGIWDANKKTYTERLIVFADAIAQ